MADDFAKWRALLAGEKPLIYMDEPISGYFRVRDKRGLNADLYVTKRPWIPCAIWRDGNTIRAELAGKEVPVETLWPWCVKSPISYEAYAYFHQHERWPEEADAA